MTEIIRYGITFIVITASFPAALFLFTLPQNEQGLSLSRGCYSIYVPWAVFLFLALLIIWQKIDFESSKILGQYFIASEMWPAESFSGFFRVRTDAASTIGVAVLSFICFFFSGGGRKWVNKKKLVCYVALMCAAGIVTGGRVFILVLAVAGLVAFICIIKINLKSILMSFPVVLLFLLLLPLMLPYQRIDESSSFIAYILPLRLGEVIFLADLLPNLSSSAFSDRASLWQHALVLLENNWLLGVSNGGFRLSNENIYQNSHTLLLQPLLEGGVLGCGVLLLLTIRSTFRRQVSFFGALIIFSVFACLLVDYQLDHSVPWNVAVAYLLVFSIQLGKLEIHSDDVSQFSTSQVDTIPLKFITNATFGFSVLLLALYYYRVNEKHELTLDERLNSFIVSRAKTGLTLVDEKLNYTVNYKNKKYLEKFILVNVVNMSGNRVCFYDYAIHRFIQATSAIAQGVKFSEFLHGNQTIGVYNTDDLNCGVQLYPQFDTFLQHRWLSSNSHFIYLSDRSEWALWWSTVVSSSLFYAQPGIYKFSYEAKGSIAYEQWPTLGLSIKNQDNQVLNETNISINHTTEQKYHFEFEINKAALVYLELSYLNDDRDLIKGEDRNLWLYPQTFKLTKK